MISINFSREGLEELINRLQNLLIRANTLGEMESLTNEIKRLRVELKRDGQEEKR